MNNKETARREKLNYTRIRNIRRNERVFSANNYTGSADKFIEINEGASPIVLASSHSVNYFENSFNLADQYTGGFIETLANEIGCGKLCISKSYSDTQRDTVISLINQYLQTDDFRVIVDLQLVDSTDDSILFLESPSSNDMHTFLKNLMKYSFEYYYRDSNVLHVVSDSYYLSNSIIKISVTNKNVTYFFLGINKKYFDIEDNVYIISLYTILLDVITTLLNLDWDIEVIRVYKLWQSAIHKPQDKIELGFTEESNPFGDESLLSISTLNSSLEKARMYKLTAKTKNSIQQEFSDEVDLSEYIFLTNRLIEILFGIDWLSGSEIKSGLRGAPIIVYSNKKEVYPIGLPKANQIDSVYFSSALYEEKKIEANRFDYILFNRVTDSRLYVDFEKLDYADYGRVRSNDGTPAKKVMMPRYYKRLMGYLDYPIEMIRKEEYNKILSNLEAKEEIDAFKDCYEEIGGEVFYRIKEIYHKDIKMGEIDPEIKEVQDMIISVQNRLGLFNSIELLKIPKKTDDKAGFHFSSACNTLWQRILSRVIGKSEYLLKTVWTSETDDKNNIASLSSKMMNLLGVLENDKIIISFGDNRVILRTLVNDDLTDFQIGIPAPARKELGMNSISDIVTVHRDMNHIFLRHSEEQMIAILGTILAVFQVITQTWIGFGLCIILIPLMMYFVLNEERTKVK